METHNYKMFKWFNRKFKINEMGPPPDVTEAFSLYAGGGDQMLPDQLLRFLVEQQGEVESSLSDSQRIIEEVLQLQKLQEEITDTATTTANATTQTQPKGQTLSLDDFFQFLFLDLYNGPVKSQVHHDMTAPLSHYFIYTGHNSYLEGNQLSSDCSNVPIIKALQRGVRVIELDLWPNSDKDDIDVLHGRTLTTPVTLIQCLKSIKEYAFVKSHYPVIITFEDHLTSDLQAKVAEMITQEFGEMLYYPQSDCLAEFPSPESLKNRILISTKPPKEFLDSKRIKDKGISTLLNGTELSEEETSGKESRDLIAEPENEYMQSESDQEDEDKIACDQKSCQKSAPEYKRLITIHAGKPKGDLQDALNVGNVVRRLSLSEQTLEKAAESCGTDVIRFTQRNILRVYPKGTRFNSSNYKPHIGWTHGAQMVAFNMQGYDKSLWLMHGMFRVNGGCGYVKKPDFLMMKGPSNEVFDPKRALIVKQTLKVKVYMGNGWSSDFSQTHFDTYSPPDFYTKVCIVGVPADCAKKKTKIIEDNWFPVWDEEFKFPLTVPELALLRIEVREYDRSEKDDFGGQTCLPVSELRQGFRSVSLYDKKGEKLKSVKLLMRFQFE
ncbi:Phosphoinositide phospholipase C [Quillaja saponaria]|uniref:Phosphoinositide phospholipase C n=1 Tax=Quillaja saponaria TaxID=32244 RepID=A0AAD7PLL3_QUISA|nr:Phosphoinositide phospholipase C [Quillaja saponaria]